MNEIIKIQANMFNVFQFGQRTNFEISCPGKFDLSYETEHYYLLDSSKPDMATEPNESAFITP